MTREHGMLTLHHDHDPAGRPSEAAMSVPPAVPTIPTPPTETTAKAPSPPAALTAAERLEQMALAILARQSFNQDEDVALKLVLHECGPLTVPAAKAAHAILSAWLCFELQLSGGERGSARLCELVVALKAYVEAESSGEYTFEEGGWRWGGP